MRAVIQVLSLLLVFAATVVAAILLAVPESWILLLNPVGAASIIVPSIGLALFRNDAKYRPEALRYIAPSMFIWGTMFTLFGLVAIATSVLLPSQAPFLWNNTVLLIVGLVQLIGVRMRAWITGRSIMTDLKAMATFMDTQQKEPLNRRFVN